METGIWTVEMDSLCPYYCQDIGSSTFERTNLWSQLFSELEDLMLLVFYASVAYRHKIGMDNCNCYVKNYLNGDRYNLSCFFSFILKKDIFLFFLSILLKKKRENLKKKRKPDPCF